MVRSMWQKRLNLFCAILIACVAGISLHAGEQKIADMTTSEKVKLSGDPTKSLSDRVTAIRSLADITSQEDEQNNKVSDALTSVVKNPGDLFVRTAAVEALGKLQKNCNQKLKERFRKTFAEILVAKDKERNFLRSGVANVFKEILDNQSLPDKDVYKTVVEIAKNRSEPEGFRAINITTVGKFGADDGIELLAGLLSDSSQIIREKAAGAIYDWLATANSDAKIPLPAVTKLVDMLTDKTMQSDLKVNVMKALAQMMRQGSTTAAKALPAIKDIVEKTEDQKLLLGGIAALGIIGTADAVEPLKKAYKDYFPEKPVAQVKPDDKDAKDKPVDSGKEVDVRKAVMDAMVSVLGTQAVKADSGKSFEPKAVHETAVLLVRALDDDPSPSVKSGAVFAMQYLYPPKFKDEHKEALDALITLMRTLKPDDDLKDKIVTALKAITDMDFEKDEGRWDAWFQSKFGGGTSHKAAAVK